MNTLTQEQVVDILENTGTRDYFEVFDGHDQYARDIHQMMCFANAAFALGVALEREECAKVCEELSLAYLHQWINNLTVELRARGMAADECTKSIRARK
jgi:hypothetical protein